MYSETFFTFQSVKNTLYQNTSNETFHKLDKKKFRRTKEFGIIDARIYGRDVIFIANRYFYLFYLINLLKHLNYFSKTVENILRIQLSLIYYEEYRENLHRRRLYIAKI